MAQCTMLGAAVQHRPAHVVTVTIHLESGDCGLEQSALTSVFRGYHCHCHSYTFLPGSLIKKYPVKDDY
ncbi:hypothetical protein TYRP_007182 [Tyrophagus putrescentiae]|nr:hypothetical protein TYRP_007182 [Tyrophagus putrescentiae]